MRNGAKWSVVLGSGAVLALAGCGIGGGGGGGGGGGSLPNAPDLRIDKPMQMTSARTTHVMFSVVNAGGVEATSIGWKVTRDDGVVAETGTIPKLASGQTQDLAISDDSTGRTFTVTVDPDNRIAEAQEGNNSTTITSIAAPSTPLAGDLRFIDAHYHGAYYYQDPLFHFFVENTTAGTVTDVWYTIQQDGTDIPGYPRRIASIEAGGSKEIFDHPYRDIATKPAGPHRYTVIIDPMNAYAESDETNNSNRSQISVPTTYGYWAIDPSGAPEIMFSDPHYHGPFGRQIVLHGWFKNAGGASGDFHFRLLRRGAPITIPSPRATRDGTLPLYGIGYTLDADGRGRFAGLAPGQVVEYVIRFEESEDGDVPYTMILDSDNEVAEQHESSDSRSWVNNNRVDMTVVMQPRE